MMTQRKRKKSETLEVRLTHESKRALMEKAAGEGSSASEIVRRSISGYLEGDDHRPKRPWLRLAALASPALTLFLAYSVSSPATADRGFVRSIKAEQARLDQDHSGTIERSEFARQRVLVLSAGLRPGNIGARMAGPFGSLASSSELRGEFAAADVNGDGQISGEEYAAYRTNIRHRGFALLDTNSDGRLSFDEYRELIGVPSGAGGRTLFAAKDRNHDGWLSAAEFDPSSRSFKFHDLGHGRLSGKEIDL